MVNYRVVKMWSSETKIYAYWHSNWKMLFIANVRNEHNVPACGRLKIIEKGRNSDQKIVMKWVVWRWGMTCSEPSQDSVEVAGNQTHKPWVYDM